EGRAVVDVDRHLDRLFDVAGWSSPRVWMTFVPPCGYPLRFVHTSPQRDAYEFVILRAVESWIFDYV
ncbi:MAG: hypothetical protein JXB07_19100, partial [Anaerolineae bacterium]|nr:hypothetical protein [Anaerolineae bacterium]